MFQVEAPHANGAPAPGLLHLEPLFNMSHQIGNDLSLSHVLQVIMETARDLFEADRAALYCRDHAGRLACPLLIGTKGNHIESICASCSTAPFCKHAGIGWPPPGDKQSALTMLGLGSECSDVTVGPGVITVPLSAVGAQAGFIAIFHDRPREFCPEDVRVAHALAGQAATLVTAARLYEAEREARRIAEEERHFCETLYAMIVRGMCSLDLTKMLQETIDDVTRLTGCDIAMVALPVSGTQSIRYDVAGGPSSALLKNVSISLAEGLTGLAARSGETVYAADLRADIRASAVLVAQSNARSGLFVPMRVRERLVGVLVLLSNQVDWFSPKHQRIARALADHAALTLDHAMVVSEREQTRQALAESERRFRQFAENAPDAIFRVDLHPAPHLSYVSPAVQSILGYCPEDIYATPNFLSRTVAADCQDVLLRLLSAPSEEPTTLRWRHRDGRAVWLEERHSLVYDAQGSPIAIEGIARDVTESKLAQEEATARAQELAATLAELRATQRQVIQEERLRALGEMASGIVHDFNNALAQILGFTELLLTVHPQDAHDPKMLASHLRSIQKAGEDAVTIVRRLREFYRYRDPGDVFLRTNLNLLVEDAVSLTKPLWKDQSQASGRVIDVNTELGHIPPIRGNPSELREVLTNLIFNAIDAIPERGNITIRTSTDGEYVRLVVEDDGRGMTEEAHRRCLEPFFTTKGPKGTGLGLAVSYGIVKRHGATLEIASAAGAGTTVTIALPIARTENVSDGETASPTKQIYPCRVLLVEDERALRYIITEYLTSDGHTVECASNGHEAIDVFRGSWFDVVITDRAMPDLNGDQVACAIKQRSPGKPVILLTGFGDVMNAVGETPAGVDLILTKPIQQEHLRDAVAAVVNARHLKSI